MSEIKKELLRKLIHFSGLLYIPVYLSFGSQFVILALIAIIAILLPIEVLRLKKGYFRLVSREYEEKKLGAHIYFLFSMLLVTLIFPRDSCFVALTTSIVGDGFAGIVRKLTGKENLASISMFFSSTIGIALLEFFQISALIAIFCGTAIERIRKVGRIYIQDNFSVPLATAFADHSVKYIISSSFKF